MKVFKKKVENELKADKLPKKNRVSGYYPLINKSDTKQRPCKEYNP